MYLHYHSATNSGVTVYLSDFCVAVMEIEFLDLGVDSLWGTNSHGEQTVHSKNIQNAVEGYNK